MTWGSGAHRRAEEFDELVGDVSSGGLADVTSARDADLLELVGALRAVPPVEARPEFVSDLRARLMAEAESVLVPDDLSRLRLPARHTRKERRLAAIVGGIAIVGATTSVAVAAQSALPGESLYPIKRVIESAHATLSLGEASKGRTELSSATSRLAEVSALTDEQGLGDEQRIQQTLNAFTQQATSGADLMLADYEHTGDQSSISTLRDFASSSLATLEDLEPRVPYSARDELISAAATVGQIGTRADERCPSCGGAPLTDIPANLLSSEPILSIPLPSTAPASAHGGKQGRPGKHHGKGTGTDTSDPQLPDVGGDVPPGSVTDPTEPSPGSNPVKDLTDGLTGALTGKGGSGGKGGGGSDDSGPVGTVVGGVVGGVGDILTGVVDPVTGLLVPSQSATP